MKIYLVVGYQTVKKTLIYLSEVIVYQVVNKFLLKNYTNSKYNFLHDF